jgi:hypothetical protein
MPILLSEAEIFYLQRLSVEIITMYYGKNTSGPVLSVLTITSWKPKTKDYNITVNSRIVIYFTDYETGLRQNDDVIGPSSLKQQLPLGKKLVLHSSCFPKLTLTCHPVERVDEASVFSKVPSLDRTKEIHIPNILWSCSVV